LLVALGVRYQAKRDWSVILLCLVAYSFPSFATPFGDVVPSEYTALSIVSGRGSSLDSYPELFEEGTPYFVTKTKSGLRSGYPIGPALLAWPVYAPAVLSRLDRSELVHRVGRFSAILFALCGVWLALRIASRLDPPCSPHMLALVYGLGTSHWSVSASQLWQHGPGELWLFGALERLLDSNGTPRRRLLALGACLSMAIFTRPVLFAPAVLIGAAALWRHKRDAIAAIAAATIIGVPIALHNVSIYGSPVGAYSAHLRQVLSPELRGSVARAFWLMVSPSRGVVWFEPVVALTLVLALTRVFRFGRRGGLLLGILGFAVVWLTYSRFEIWWGGICFGPRYMTDALPMWFLAVASMGPIGPWFTKAAVALSATGALLTTAYYVGGDSEWSDPPNIDWFPERAQSLRDSQLVTSLLMVLPDSELELAERARSRGDQVSTILHLQKALLQHPWNRFAAIRLADSLLEEGRIDEASSFVANLPAAWKKESYLRHLELRLPRIARFLESGAWVKPLDAAASRNKPLARDILDGTIRTGWTTGLPQQATDWLMLKVDPQHAVRGIALLSAPEFGNGPLGFVLYGRTVGGETIRLGTNNWVTASMKGWVAMRFRAVYLDNITVRLLRYHPAPWTVTEARMLLANQENDLGDDDDGAGR
jgi:hypothetical protein